MLKYIGKLLILNLCLMTLCGLQVIAKGAMVHSRIINEVSMDITSTNVVLENENSESLMKKFWLEVINDDSLSANAKNVEVIQHNKQLILRGYVNNQHEKYRVHNKAETILRMDKIINKLEIVKR